MRRNNIIQVIDGMIIFAGRTKDENTGRYTSATYYMVTLDSDPLVENTDGTIAEIPEYKSVMVAEPEAADAILYADGGKYFVEFVDGQPKLLCMANETFVATESKTLSSEEIETLESTFLPTDGSTILSAYIVTSPTSTRQLMVQIREKTVGEETTTYAYVADIYV